jgi:Zn-dependent protease with chaperone function
VESLAKTIDTSKLPRLGRIDLSALWDDMQLRPTPDMVPGLDLYEARHDEWTEKIRLMGLDGGLMVDYRILPGLDALLGYLFGQAGWARPEVYVVSDLGRKGVDSWSAVSVVSNRCPVILLGTSLAESLSEVELAFVIGHETGHLLSYNGQWRKELSLSFLIRELAEANSMEKLSELFPDNRWRVLYQAVMENCRIMESRCDRLGLLMCGDWRKASGALLTVALKNPVLGRGVNLDNYLAVHYPQLTTSPAMGPISVNAGHPFIPQRIRAIHDFVQSGKCEAFAAEYAR